MTLTKQKAVLLLQPWRWAGYIFRKSCNPVPWGIVFSNFFFQRILRINGNYSFPINFTSKVTGDVKIGEKVWISFAVSGGCYIQGGNGIEIGDYTIFAPGVKIISANHSMDAPDKWGPDLPIVIGKRCWIGANAVILPGVTLGDGVVVGAGAVVTKSVPQDSVVAGVPARIIKGMGISSREIANTSTVKH